VGLAAGISLASCGLINSDATNFAIALPDKKFTINADSWQVDQTAADQFLSVSCQSSSQVCSSEVQQACPMGCTGSCDAAKATCDLSLDISLSQPIDLMMEQPQLKTLSDESAIKVSVDTVTYAITANGLSVETPPLTVYVAPMSVISSSDTQSTEIGTIPAVPAGQRTTEPLPIAFTATGKDKLDSMLSTFKTPFNVLIGASLHLTSGQPVPTGELDAVLNVTGHAGL
jgi:hypothetical protein